MYNLVKDLGFAFVKLVKFCENTAKGNSWLDLMVALSNTCQDYIMESSKNNLPAFYIVNWIITNWLVFLLPTNEGVGV